MTIREVVQSATWLNTTVYKTEDIQDLIVSLYEYLDTWSKKEVTAYTGPTQYIPSEFKVITTGSAERAVVESHRDYRAERSTWVNIGLASRNKMMTTDLERMSAWSDHATIPQDVVATLIKAYLSVTVWPNRYDFYRHVNQLVNPKTVHNYQPEHQAVMLLPFVSKAEIHMGDRVAGATDLEAYIRAWDTRKSCAGRLAAFMDEEKQLEYKLESIRAEMISKRERLDKVSQRLCELEQKHPEYKLLTFSEKT